MVSKAFFTGSKYLVEENDGRNDYLRYEGEKFLTSLVKAGRKVIKMPIEADEQKSAYLKMLVELNERYFVAREYENEAKGKYLKHDKRAERRFRIKTAEQFTECVSDLHSILNAHDALVNAAVEYVEGTREGTERQKALKKVRSALYACTDRAITGGWFPMVESFYYSLNPGEHVPEERKRRELRIEGTEESLGIRELLGKPYFERLSERDLRRIREINRQSPGPDPEVWKRFFENYTWYIGHDRDDATTGEDDESE